MSALLLRLLAVGAERWEPQGTGDSSGSYGEDEARQELIGAGLGQWLKSPPENCVGVADATEGADDATVLSLVVDFCLYE